MHRKQWIFDMDGTLTDSMTVVWQAHRWSCCAAMAAPQDPTSTMFF